MKCTTPQPQPQVMTTASKKPVKKGKRQVDITLQHLAAPRSTHLNNGAVRSTTVLQYTVTTVLQYWSLYTLVHYCYSSTA